MAGDQRKGCMVGLESGSTRFLAYIRCSINICSKENNKNIIVKMTMVVTGTAVY